MQSAFTGRLDRSFAARPHGPESTSAPLVILASTHAVGEDSNQSVTHRRAALETVVRREIPIVFVSASPGRDVEALQRDLRIRQPFICDGGGCLYIPVAYFPEVRRIGSERDGWNIVEFKGREDVGRAIRLLASLYRLASEHVVLVGVGHDASDLDLLRHVDVPVIIRHSGVDPAPLVHALPSAYLTTATGYAGWLEAMLGAAAE